MSDTYVYVVFWAPSSSENGVATNVMVLHIPKEAILEGPSAAIVQEFGPKSPFRVLFLEPESLSIGCLDPLASIVSYASNMPQKQLFRPRYYLERKGFPVAPQYEPLSSLKGSRLWAPVLKVVCVYPN